MSKKVNNSTLIYLGDCFFWGSILSVWLIVNDFRFMVIGTGLEGLQEWWVSFCNFLVIVWPFIIIKSVRSDMKEDLKFNREDD